MRRVLLTGITGFIGSHLAERLLGAGWGVQAVVRASSDLSVLPNDVRQQVAFHVHGAGNSLPDIVKAARPEVVIHLASLFLSQHTYGDIDALVSSNVTFGTELLEAMRINGVRNFINTGTAWQHYENAAYSPVNLYAATKQAFEAIVTYYRQAADFKVITLKLFDTYGPGDRRRKLLSLFDECAASGQELAMSPGEQKIDLVHVSDVAAAFALAADYLFTGAYENCGTYAVSSGQAISLRELARRYERLSGRRLNIRWGGRGYREREVMVPWHGGRLLPGWRREHTYLM